MDEKITPTILVVKTNGTKSLMEKLALARSFMITVIIYAQCVKAVKALKQEVNKIAAQKENTNE